MATPARAANSTGRATLANTGRMVQQTAQNFSGQAAPRQTGPSQGMMSAASSGRAAVTKGRPAAPAPVGNRVSGARAFNQPNMAYQIATAARPELKGYGKKPTNRGMPGADNVVGGGPKPGMREADAFNVNTARPQNLQDIINAALGVGDGRGNGQVVGDGPVAGMYGGNANTMAAMQNYGSGVTRAPTAAAPPKPAAMPQELTPTTPTVAQDDTRQRADQSLMGTQSQFIPTTGANGLPTFLGDGNLTPAQLRSNLADVSYDAGRYGIDPMVQTARGASTTLNNATDTYMDDVGITGMTDGLQDMEQAGRDWMDPERAAAANRAAQEQLDYGVNSQRDAAIRQQMDQASRGGRMGSGSLQGAYTDAMRASQEGQRGLTQENFNRELEAARSGNQMAMDAIGARYGITQDQFTSPKEFFEAILQFVPELADAATPF